MNSPILMRKLRDIDILDCNSLESIFPICYVEGLAQLQNMSIKKAPKLEYVFGKRDHENHSSYQYKNHVMLPHLEVLELHYVENLIGMCPENCEAKWPSESMRIVDILGCPKLAIPWFNLKADYDKSQHHLNEIWSFQCLQSLTSFDCEELKCLFSMETHRSLPELMYLSVSNRQELEQLVVANEELVQLPNAELYFPKLIEIKVYNCNKLKSLFPLSMVFRHSQGDSVLNELEIVLPNLTEITLLNLPNFVDICHGSKLDAVKLLILSKTASTLIQTWNFQCLRELALSNCKELKCLFSMGTHRSIPELMKLCVYDCQELEQIVAESEELVQLPNAELYFPKLKEITVFNCNKLKSLFPISMVTMLPQLSTLDLTRAAQLQEVFRHSREDDIMNQREIVLSNLEEITLADLPNFVDICHGCKLHAVKLLRFFIYECPKTSPSLRQIQNQTGEAYDETEEAASEDNEDPPYPYDETEEAYYETEEAAPASEDNEDPPDPYDETEEAAYGEEQSEPDFTWHKGKSIEIDFAVDKDETEEAWWSMEEPSMPMFASDKGKAKEIKKGIVESGISDQNLNISP
ncbi:hypothetical protein P8452_20081 [Trifolium repens]|nr:hypothetical protein P8452_20081 [Trifolium repens]